jgi:chromosome condensin MukBEF MukE localization factor
MEKTNFTIDVDSELIAKKVADAVANSVVGRVISQTLSGRGLKEEAIARQYDEAVQNAAREIFFEHLKASDEFRRRCLKMIEQRLTDQFVEKLIEKVARQIW